MRANSSGSLAAENPAEQRSAKKTSVMRGLATRGFGTREAATRRVQKLLKQLQLSRNKFAQRNATAGRMETPSEKSDGGGGAIEALQKRQDNSFLRELTADPKEKELFPNHASRPVRTGHFVRIAPTPLRDPFLVTYSKDMAKRLGLSEEQIKSPEFVSAFAGDTFEAKQGSEDKTVSSRLEAWCTPYAVSVAGQPIPAPDPFNGYGYGDGRACSIGEFQSTSSPEERWELQLKGCGPTPFSRQFDGRAVLRSSVREFLVSEAMHALGCPTTRALSLVASGQDTVDRAWYRPGTVSESRDFPPDYMVVEQCAITCRAASSFIRVGQIELYARRLAREDSGALEGYKAFLTYTIRREFPSVKLSETPSDEELAHGCLGMLSEFAQRQAHLVQSWIRVGYVQGNMNSDNCLLAGLTMDYGPFGFMEPYIPTWNPFTSDPMRNFGFERQPRATHINLATLTEALMPILEKVKGCEEMAEEIVQKEFVAHHVKERTTMRKEKLGLLNWDAEEMDTALWGELLRVLVGLDYTVFFRELSSIPRQMLGKKDDEEIVSLVEKALYEPLGDAHTAALAAWLRTYSSYLEKEGRSDEERLAAMKLANPKFVPREWMLVQAYEAAKKADFEPLRRLQRLFETPYDEHEGEDSDEFYRPTPTEHRRVAGVSFFSCSS